MLIALVLGLIGIAAYYASNTSFEMLSLSNQYAVAITEISGLPSLERGTLCWLSIKARHSTSIMSSTGLRSYSFDGDAGEYEL